LKPADAVDAARVTVIFQVAVAKLCSHRGKQFIVPAALHLYDRRHSIAFVTDSNRIYVNVRDLPRACRDGRPNLNLTIHDDAAPAEIKVKKNLQEIGELGLRLRTTLYGFLHSMLIPEEADQRRLAAKEILEPAERLFDHGCELRSVVDEPRI